MFGACLLLATLFCIVCACASPQAHQNSILRSSGISAQHHDEWVAVVSSVVVILLCNLVSLEVQESSLIAAASICFSFSSGVILASYHSTSNLLLASIAFGCSLLPRLLVLHISLPSLELDHHGMTLGMLGVLLVFLCRRATDMQTELYSWSLSEGRSRPTGVLRASAPLVGMMCVGVCMYYVIHHIANTGVEVNQAALEALAYSTVAGLSTG